MQALDFLNKVADYEGKNLFLLYGEEAYLVDRCRETLLAAWNVPFPEMNLTVFQEKVSYADLFGACIQAPCFADLRVIVLEEVDVSEKALRFADILEKLPPQSKLVLCFSKKPDMRKGIYKDLKKCAVCAEADSLKPDALVKWMQSTAKRGGVQLSREMAELLVEISGGEMYALKNELDKLKFAGQKRPGRAEILQIAAGSTEYDIFAFHKEMMASRYEAAFAIFEKVRRDRSALIGFLGLLVSKFAPMYMARQCADAGMSERQIADRLCETTGMKPYPALFAARDCRAFQLEEIRRALQELETMDHRLKSGGGMSEYRTAFLRMYGKI